MAAVASLSALVARALWELQALHIHALEVVVRDKEPAHAPPGTAASYLNTRNNTCHDSQARCQAVRRCMVGDAPDDLQEEVAVLPDVACDEAVQQAWLALRRAGALPDPALPVLPLRGGPGALRRRPPLRPPGLQPCSHCDCNLTRTPPCTRFTLRRPPGHAGRAGLVTHMSAAVRRTADAPPDSGAHTRCCRHAHMRDNTAPHLHA